MVDPLASPLTPAREEEIHHKIQPRLRALWKHLEHGQDEPYTSVVVPSLSLDPEELRRIDAIDFYEERLLFTLIRLRNPRARVVYVTSQPVHPSVLEYYFQLLAGIPGSHARSRLTLLAVHDSSPRPLTTKILERPRLIERIAAGIPDRTRAFLTCFNSTPLERRLAVLLGIPLDGTDPSLTSLGSKSGSRKIFREAKIELPAGSEGIHSTQDLVDALVDLKKRHPHVRRAVVKLDDSFSGQGNAVFRYPKELTRSAIESELTHLELAKAGEDAGKFLPKLSRMGGVVEEMIEGAIVASPSAQFRISPDGVPRLISTHDQILGGPSGQTFLGCRFPAADGYRLAIQERAMKVAAVLAAKGVIGPGGVDFMAVRQGDNDWRLAAVEINLRKGGTTHPFLALEFLTDGRLDPEDGLFRAPGGQVKFYRCTDNLVSPRYRGLLPDDVVDIATANGLQYKRNSQTGVLFHMIGAVSQYGKLGLTAIGNTPGEVETLYSNTLAVLDRETAPRRVVPPEE